METKVFLHGNVYTGDGFTEAFAVENGRFVAAGSDTQILAKYPDGEQTDLGGSFVCAAFNDSHMHLLNYGQALSMARLDQHTSSLKEMLKYVKEYTENSKGSWIVGRGWNQDYFSDADRMPSKEDLDRISRDKPIILTRACGHVCTVNSKLLEIAGISKDTVSPDGGSIDYENGILCDNAIDIVEKYKPLPNKEEIKQMILASCAKLNSFGITSSQSDDYGVYREIPFETINEAYKELSEEGRLSVRVNEQANFTTLKDLKDFIHKGNMTSTGDDMFRIGPLKMLGDGSLGGRTAHLSRPYADDPSTCGFSLFSDEQFNDMIGYANRKGMQVAVHAIGDACLDKVLNAIEKALTENPRNDHRHGIVHCQISRQDQLDRMIRLKTHIYAQSVFLDYDNHIVEQRAGKDLASTSYSWKTLMNNGLTVSNGSDAPVETPDVMKGIECAVTRTSLDGCGPYLPDQAFTVKEAIDSFTYNGAIASFEEDHKGKIAPGYLADFVILDQDPFVTEKNRIHEIGINATYLSGKCVYKK
ncbi:MAG: amidohydrolase [Erysipelotrichaceae bacterium]|nr:amidohydrolase [Erysipelotrichaceae bacterium]